MNGTNTIEALREELFKTLRGLTDKSNPMDIERAKAVADVGQTIINSAKVEVEHLRVTGGSGTGFIPVSAATIPGGPSVSETPTGTKTVFGNTTTHKLR